MMLIVSMSALIGNNNVEAQANKNDTVIEVVDEQDLETTITGEMTNNMRIENNINRYTINSPIHMYFNDFSYPCIVDERNATKPFPIKPLHSKPIVEEIEDERQLVALTFDDGPGKYTMDLIDILYENDAKATFFLLGPCVKNYPDTVVYMYEKGNEIANHGYSHKEFTKMSLEDIQEEIDTTEQLIESYGVECSDFVRPPYLCINNKIIENIDSTFIVWSIDTEDWKSRDVECIKETIIGKIKEGDIILLHDIHKTTVDAIAEILPELTDEYRFVTVSELFELQEVEYEKNKMYSKVKK